MRHTLKADSRKLFLSPRKFVRGGINSDTIAVDTDAEWDQCDRVIVTVEHERIAEPWVHQLDGGEFTMPSGILEAVGTIRFSLTGYVGDEQRVTTERMTEFTAGMVVESGTVSGGGTQPQDASPDLWLQLMQQLDDATGALGAEAEKAAESATAAKESENAAKSASEKATEAASSALDYSRTADRRATAATSAAESADSSAASAIEAASSAEEASKSAVEASESAVSASDSAAESAESAIAAAGSAAEAAQSALSVAGNSLTGTVSGTVANADDAYAAKPREVRVEGKTRQNLWVNPSGATHGVTVSNDDDGSLTVTGTASGAAIIGIDSYALKQNSEYTISTNKQTADQPSQIVVWVRQYNSSGSLVGNIISIGDAGNTSKTFTTESDMSYVEMSIAVYDGVTVDLTGLCVMLNEGDAAEPWCPPGLNSVKPEKLVTAGKNLLKGGFEKSGIRYYFPASLVSGSNLTIKNVADGSVNFGVAAEVGSEPELLGNRTPQQSLEFSLTQEQASLGYIVVYSGYDLGLTEGMEWQLELGSTATEYEPPQVTETALPSDIELRAIKNEIADTLSIGDDGVSDIFRTTMKLAASDIVVTSNVYPASGDNLPYVLAVNGIGFPQGSTDFCKTVLSTGYPSVGDTLKKRGVYRSWTNLVFVDDRFTDRETAQELIRSTGGEYIFSIPESTEQLGTVDLPQLPAPTFNVYTTGGDVQPTVDVDYERDVNIVIGRLEQAVSVAQAGVNLLEA